MHLWKIFRIILTCKIPDFLQAKELKVFLWIKCYAMITRNQRIYGPQLLSKELLIFWKMLIWHGFQKTKFLSLELKALQFFLQLIKNNLKTKIYLPLLRLYKNVKILVQIYLLVSLRTLKLVWTNVLNHKKKKLKIKRLLETLIKNIL